MIRFALLFLSFSALSEPFERPGQCSWDIPTTHRSIITGFNVSIQCNARPESITFVGGLIGVYNMTLSQIGVCSCKVQTVSASSVSEWSLVSTETITLPPVTGATIE